MDNYLKERVIKTEIEDNFIDYSIVKEEYCIQDNIVSSASLLSSDIKKENVELEDSTVNTKADQPCSLRHNYQCGECGQKYPSISSVKLHFRRVHDKKEKFKPTNCPICGTLYKRKFDYEKHVASHSKEVKLECKVCLKPFKTKKTLRNHYKNLHLKSTTIKASTVQSKPKNHQHIECPFCSKAFTQKKNLKLHSSIHHRGLPVLDDPPLTCTICKKVYKNLDDLKEHGETHPAVKAYECAICRNKYNSKITLTRHILQVHLKIYKKQAALKCTFCSKSFRHKYYLREHLYTHSNERSFECEICNKKYKRKYNLKIHKLTHSNKNQAFTCLYCPKSFSTITYFRMHIYKEHRGLPVQLTGPLFCNICKEDFKDFDDLKEHVKIHEVVNTYQCEVCGMVYSSYNGLKHHKRNKKCAELDEVKIRDIIVKGPFYECKFCGKSIKQKYAYERHIKSYHTNDKKFLCADCPKTYADKQGIARHVILHKKYKEFKCSVCKEGFNTKSALERHSPTHITTSFTCSICSDTFPQNILLDLHMLNHRDELLSL